MDLRELRNYLSLKYLYPDRYLRSLYADGLLFLHDNKWTKDPYGWKVADFGEIEAESGPIRELVNFVLNEILLKLEMSSFSIGVIHQRVGRTLSVIYKQGFFFPKVKVSVLPVENWPSLLEILSVLIRELEAVKWSIEELSKLSFAVFSDVDMNPISRFLIEISHEAKPLLEAYSQFQSLANSVYAEDALPFSSLLDFEELERTLEDIQRLQIRLLKKLQNIFKYQW